MTLALLVRFVEIVCVRSDGFEHMNTDHDNSEAVQIDGCNIRCYAEWLNSFRRCGWRHRAYFLTGINLNDSASVSVRRDIMECFIFVLKPDWSLYIQDGFFTWFTAHKANSALLTSSFSRSLSDISGCMWGIAGNQTTWRQDVKRMKSDDNSGRMFRWKYMYGSFLAICSTFVMPKDEERHDIICNRL